MKTKKQIQEMINLINQQIVSIDTLYENKSMLIEEYSQLRDKFDTEKNILHWVLSNEWEADDLKILECFDICFNNDDTNRNWSDKSPCAMHFEFELETWFDVDEKFGLNITDKINTWCNLFVFYDPFNDELFVEYSIDSPNDIEYHDYIPTKKERSLIVSIIEEWCQKTSGKTAKEMIQEIINETIQYYEVEFGKEKELNDNTFVNTPDRFFICIKADHYPTEKELLEFCKEDLDNLGYDAICTIKRLSYCEAHTEYNMKNEKEFPILKKGES